MKIFKGKKKTAPERPEICLSLGCRTMDQMEEEILKYRGYCQTVEWKVDRISGSAYYTKEEFTKKLKEVKALCRGKKLIVNYKGDEDTTARIQKWALGTADMIDIDISDPHLKEIVRAARRKRTGTIISYYDFEGMPSKEDIATQFVRMEKSGGDILKIACLAKEEADTYSMLEAAGAYTQLKNHKPIIAVAMGDEGQASRICAGDFGSVMTYACGSTPGEAGELSARDMCRYLDTYYKGK